jgi:hypothetical protein
MLTHYFRLEPADETHRAGSGISAAEKGRRAGAVAFERAAGFGKRRLPALPAPTPALAL